MVSIVVEEVDEDDTLDLLYFTPLVRRWLKALCSECFLALTSPAVGYPLQPRLVFYRGAVLCSILTGVLMTLPLTISSNNCNIIGIVYQWAKHLILLVIASFSTVPTRSWHDGVAVWSSAEIPIICCWAIKARAVKAQPDWCRLEHANDMSIFVGTLHHLVASRKTPEKPQKYLTFLFWVLCVCFLMKNMNCRGTQIKFSALFTADMNLCRPARGKTIITDTWVVCRFCNAHNLPTLRRLTCIFMYLKQIRYPRC